MTIKYKDFTFTPGNSVTGFDVVREVPVVARNQEQADKHGVEVGSPTGNTTEQLVGYDMRLEYALNQVILYILSDKDDVVNLKEFLVAYVKEKEELLSMVKQALKTEVVL